MTNYHYNNQGSKRPNGQGQKPGSQQGKSVESRPRRRRQSQDFAISLTGKNVFGAYFNMARTNFVKTINYILPIAGVRGKYEENKIDKMLHALFLIQAGRSAELTPEQREWRQKLILNPEQQERLKSLLFRHFPMLKPMMADFIDHKIYKNKKKSTIQTDDEAFGLLRGVSLADCLDMVLLMAETLTECRNFYTHADPYNSAVDLAKQYQHQAAIAKKLDKLVVASRRVLKERENLSVEEVEFLTGVDHMAQIPRKDEAGQVIRDEKGRKQMKFVEYDDFYFKISGTRPVQGLSMTGPDGQPTTVDSQLPALSDFGLLFFCVLFLSKPYAKLFIEEARLFEFSPFTEAENLVMREMLSIYRIRTPRLHRIDSREDKAALSMDIFGELRRCPMELYNLLDKETDQPFFHDVVKHPNDYTPEVSKRQRHTDRFPHLALRYVDATKLFERIRFQLQLGAFRFRFYDKKNCIDGRPRVRRIQKEINGYGRLQEVEDKRFEKWGDLIQKREEREVKLEHEDMVLDLDQFLQDTADSIPYITDRRPAYNIHAGRIGLFWERSRNPKDFKYFEDGMYIPQLIVSEDLRAPISMPEPLCSLSVHDLPAMLFYEYLRGQQEGRKFKSAEQIIIDCEGDFRRFFASVADGSLKPFAREKELREYLSVNFPNLHLADIPEKIRLYLCGQPLRHNNEEETARQRLVRLTLEHLEEREQKIAHRLEHYQEDRKKIGEKDNKIGKKDHADVRHGALARYIAQSLMLWQPSIDGIGHGKLTGVNYNALTAYLATFGTPQPEEEDFTPRTLLQVLQAAHLVDGANPHPFINKVLARGNRNIEELYLHYLDEELNHIRACRQSLQNDPSDAALAALPFVRHERVRFHERTAEEVRALAGRYTTIQLPDGLFTPYLLTLLKDCYADNAELQEGLKSEQPDKLNPTLNAAYLITLFYQKVLKDDAQPFYSFKRAYDLFAILRNERKTVFPFELIPYALTSDEVQQRLSAKLLDIAGEPIPKDLKRGKPIRDEQGNVIWKRQVNQQIEDYVLGQSDRDLKLNRNQPEEKKDREREEKREALRAQLLGLVREIKKTERALRRYKTQDMVLFLLAKEIFKSIINERSESEVSWKHFLLSNVCNEDFLRQTLTFRVPVKVGAKTVYVEQKNMSLKNYGEFYRFLTDDRFSSLMDNIIDTLKPNEDGELVISHTDLMSELAAYDQIRSTVFRLIQSIERLIIDQTPVLQDATSPDFWAREGLPKRNNFASLLELLDKLNGIELTADERTLLVSIRNAFSHNSYRVDLSKIRNIGNLPEVARGILHHLESLTGAK